MNIEFPKSFLNPRSPKRSEDDWGVECYRFDYSGSFYGRNEIGFTLSEKRKDRHKSEADDKDLVKIVEDIAFFSDEYLTINIQGKKFLLHCELEDIFEEIIHSHYLLDLEDDWDNMGAAAIKFDTYISAINFLIRYSNTLVDLHSTVITSPEINPCFDGSIDLSWKTDKVRLLINFKMVENSVRAIYYRDFYDNKNSSKGSLPLDELNESFLVWMKALK